MLPLVIWCILNSEFSEDRVLMILQLVVLCMYVCVFMYVLCNFLVSKLHVAYVPFPFKMLCLCLVSEFYT